ncbi:MAG: LPS export ABC transporter periplasmic protein LptC [Gammaproteobacteria bacterium]|nr:LPS export ABC transporter periplasmic protein LptC [Gammaproteobacteria bacterium]
MKLLTKTPFFLFILTLLVITALFYASYESSSAGNYNLIPAKTEKPKSVNFFIQSMELIINNEQGSHKAVLISPKVNHDPSQNITKLLEPVLILNQDNVTWRITANNGQIIHDNKKIKQIEKIILSDKVKIIRTALTSTPNKTKTNANTNNLNNNNLSFLDLETEELTYFPKEDILSNNKKVTIKTKESITTAIGLKFHKPTQKLELLSNVKSVYYDK